jgi:hypothetical protein
MKRDEREDRWIATGVCVAAATWLFAAPLYRWLQVNPGAVALLRLALEIQLLPAAAMTALWWAMRRRRRLAQAYLVALIVLSAGSIVRIGQEEFTSDLYTVPAGQLLLVFTVVVAAVIVLGVRWTRGLIQYFALTAPLLAVATIGFLVVLALGPAVLTHQEGAARPAGRTAILIIFDELGRDVLTSADGSIDASRYPNVARFASEATFFDNAASAHADTCRAIPEMLAGAITIPDCLTYYQRSDPDLLRDLAASYTVGSYGEFLPDCQLRSVTVCHGASAFVADSPQLALLKHFVPSQFRVGPIADVLIPLSGSNAYFPVWSTFLGDLTRDASPGRAYFVHVMLPHFPFVYGRDGRPARSPDRYFTGTAHDTVTYASYQRQVEYVDTLIGQLIDRLQQQGLWSTTTVAMTGDHGPRAGPGRAAPVAALDGLSAQTPWIPLLVRAPGFAPGVDATPLTLADFRGLLQRAYGLTPTPPQRPTGAPRTFDWGAGRYVLKEGVGWVSSVPR